MDGGDASMNNKLVTVLALVAGLAGGLLSRYAAPPSAFAQNQAPVTKEVRAESFTLVDSTDRTVGTFTAEPDASGGIQPFFQPGPSSRLNVPQRLPTVLRTRIVLRDSSGREIWSAGGSSIRQLSQR
jgi:hypothetical protein